MLHHSDLPPLLLPFKGRYDCCLNSEDTYIEDLSLTKSRAHGGTMVMWQTSLSPFITILPTVSSSFQSILLKLPGTITSLHTVLYLPTSGKEDQFMSSLVLLGEHFEEIRTTYPDSPHFVRGDANVNPNNAARHGLFSYFCVKFQLESVPLNHPTYHHFVGNGSFDSEIDVIMFYSPLNNASEQTMKIACKLENPFVESQHDVIISNCSLPTAPVSPPNQHLIKAPRIPNDRIKIIWTEEGIRDYEKLVGNNLADIRKLWGNPSSRSSISVLLSSTYSCLNFAARATNNYHELSTSKSSKPSVNPKIRTLEKAVLKANKNLKQVSNSSPSLESTQAVRTNLRNAKADLRQAVRAEKSSLRNQRDENLSAMLTNPSTAFRSIKSAKASSSASVHNLNVNGKVYSGENVSDGFFDSLSSLKSPHVSTLLSTKHFQHTLMDYQRRL